MEKIFLRNYKGFKNQIIELEDINFLVGENSTGKTSVLKIINLLSSAEFWFDFEFNNSEVELGYFDEIISKNIDEKFIQLGLEKNKNNDEKEEKVPFRILLEFKQLQSIPAIDKIKVSFENFDVLIRITKNEIRFRTKEISNISFDEWVNDFSFPKTYKRLSIPFMRLPFPIMLNMIQQEIKGHMDKSFSRNSFQLERLYNRYKWVAPIRAKAKRLYESYKINFSPEGDHIPQVLRQILTGAKSREQKKIITTLEKFGKESNLFDKIEINELGKKNSSPFEINVKYKDIEVQLPNVGYGVSQSLPIIIEILSSTKTCFSIQQPEVHLHPKAQAAFGSFLFYSLINDKNKFIIETHSDFTINRLRYELLKNKTKKEINSKVLFFERSFEGNNITNIRINPNGSYEDTVPDSYREFFIDEELKLLEI